MKLQQTILPVTVNLQTFLDKEENRKKAELQISAKFKKTAIRTATEATAIAIGVRKTDGTWIIYFLFQRSLDFATPSINQSPIFNNIIKNSFVRIRSPLVRAQAWRHLDS